MKRLAIFILLSSLFVPALAQAQDTTQTIVDFTGELVDQNAAPISGVLPLEFRLYTDSKSKKAIATEKHFIAVVDGNYAVSLGQDGKLKTKNDKLYVAVYLDGKELTRQEVDTQKQLVANNPKIVKTKSTKDADGNTFKLECPTGYVVTGIEGNAKNGLQDLQLICSKAVQL